MASILIPDRSEPTEEFASARFSVDEYFEMVARDAFAGLGRIELLEGRLVRKMTKNPPHRVALARTERALRPLLPTGWHLANQEPVRLRQSAPEPDLAIVRGQVDDYSQRHPGPADIALLIEVADESLRTDRRKARTYAAEGIPEYWIVNVRDRRLEVSGFRQRCRLSPSMHRLLCIAKAMSARSSSMGWNPGQWTSPD